MIKEIITYEYSRLKAIIEDDKADKMFLGMCDITIIIVQKFANNTRTKMITDAGFSMSEPIKNVPWVLQNLPNREDAFHISETEYECWIPLQKKNELAYLLYRTAI